MMPLKGLGVNGRSSRRIWLTAFSVKRPSVFATEDLLLTRRESRSIVFEGKEETHGQRFGTRRARGDDPFPDDPGEDGVIHFGLPRRLGDGHLFDPAGFVDAEGQFHAVFPVDALRDLDVGLGPEHDFLGVAALLGSGSLPLRRCPLEGARIRHERHSKS